MIADDVRVRTRDMSRASAGVEKSRLGIEGAEETQLALSVLNERWFLLSDLKLGAHQVLDHLLVGPTGVFAITSVHPHGLDVVASRAGLHFEDRWRPVVQEADLMTLAAQQQLRRVLGGVEVHPIVSVVCAAGLEVSTTAACPVVRVEDLVGHVQQLESVLLVDKVREIVEAARRLETFDRDEVDEMAAQAYRETTAAVGCSRGYVLRDRTFWTSTALDRRSRGVGQVGRTYALLAFWLGLASLVLVALPAVPSVLFAGVVLARHRRGRLPGLALAGMIFALVGLIGWLSLGVHEYTGWIERLGA